MERGGAGGAGGGYSGGCGGGGSPTPSPFSTLQGFGQQANLISGQVEGCGPGNKAVLCPTRFCCSRAIPPPSKRDFLKLTLIRQRAFFFLFEVLMALPVYFPALCPTRAAVIGKKSVYLP